MLDEFNTPKTAAASEPTAPARMARPAPTPPMPPSRGPSLAPPQRDRVMEADTLERIKVIEAAIEELRPFLKRDGGDCELVDVEGNTIYVRLTGACVGCHMASVTIHGVQERLIAMLRTPLRVIPVG